MADQIIQVIEALCEKFGIVIDWSAKSLVPVITELANRYANYVLFTNIAYIAIYIVFVIMGIKFSKWASGKAKEHGGFGEWAYNDEFTSIMFTVFLIMYIIVMVVYSLVMMGCIIPETIQAITIPEILFANKVMSYLG